MTSDTNVVKASPGPFGFFAYGMTVIMLCLSYVGVIPDDMGIFCMILIFGGFGEFFAGIWSFKNGDTFGATAFTAYGLFWWSLAVIYLNPLIDFIPAASNISLGFYLLLWGIFTLIMLLCVLKADIVTKIIFITLTLLFILLAIGDFTQIHAITVVAGVIGIISGIFAFISSAKGVMGK